MEYIYLYIITNLSFIIFYSYFYTNFNYNNGIPQYMIYPR